MGWARWALVLLLGCGGVGGAGDEGADAGADAACRAPNDPYDPQPRCDAGAGEPEADGTNEASSIPAEKATIGGDKPKWAPDGPVTDDRRPSKDCWDNGGRTTCL